MPSWRKKCDFSNFVYARIQWSPRIFLFCRLEKKIMNIRTVVLFVVLLLAAGLYWYFYYEKEGSSFSMGESNFNIEDTSSLDKISLTRVVQGEEKLQLILEKKEGEWMVNERFGAFQPRVDQMLEVLTKIKIREALSEAARHSALKFFSVMHTRLDIYEKGKKKKSILIGTQTKDAKGTVMMLAGSKSPYVLEIPGLPGYLNVYFPMELNEWRENLLFVADDSRLESLEIRFDTLEGGQDVYLTEMNGVVKVNGESKQGGEDYIQKNFQAKRRKIYGESFVGADYPDKLRELKGRTADVIFSVKYTDGTSRTLHLYKRGENPNNYFAWIEGEDELITVQKFVIDRFIWTREDFLRNAQT